MEITGKVQVNYKLDIYRINDHYNIAMSFRKPNKKYELMDFFIRKDLKSIIKLMEKEYNITISPDDLKAIHDV